MNITRHDDSNGWRIIDSERNVRIFFANNKFNLCYALKGRTEKEVSNDYYSLLKDQNIDPNKVAWFNPKNEDQTIKKITLPIYQEDNFDYLLSVHNIPMFDIYKNVLWTDEKNLTLGMHSADCVPLIFIADNKICLCHLYWWHTFNGFLQLIIDKLKDNNFNNIVAVIGPHNMQELTRNINNIGEKTFVITKEIEKIIIENKIPFFPVYIDTFTNDNLWSYAKDHNCGNQATIVTMY